MGGACGCGLTTGAASGEAVSAEQQEKHVSRAAGLRVGVYRESPDTGAVRAEDATDHCGSGTPDAEEENG